MDITKELKKLEDSKYKEFEAKLIPNIRKEEIIGVRVPQIRNLSKIIPKEDKIKFINDIPHKYHEENLLNAIIINGIKDYDKCIIKVNEFIPYINNWSVCDTLNPKVFKKNKDKLILEVDNWIKSEKTYIQRFALLMIMRNFLDDDFKKEYLDYPIIIENDDYYIKMAKAWFYCEALIKKWDFAIKYIEERKLDKWVLNKAIQKSIESFRISDDKKEYLRILKIK
ncbi:MAG: DNA alkylation repair protein [Tissierellia bacterium]|nr:DNA alkylation repair protein [Tissierellia bacterium]